MELLFAVLNSSCNRDCTFCFYNIGHQKKRDEIISTKDIIDFCRFLKGKGLRNVILSGGEPLLFNYLETLIRNLSEMEIVTLLLTNGELLSIDRKKTLMKNRLSAITVSLQVEEADEGKLRTAMESASEGLDIPLTFILTLTAKNFILGKTALALALKMNKGLILQPAYIPKSNKMSCELSIGSLSSDDFNEFKKILSDWGKSFGAMPYTELLLSLYPSRKLSPKTCRMGASAMVLNSDGEVIPCFHKENIAAGNILKDDYADILKQNRKISKELQHAACFGEHCVSLFTGI